MFGASTLDSQIKLDLDSKGEKIHLDRLGIHEWNVFLSAFGKGENGWFTTLLWSENGHKPCAKTYVYILKYKTAVINIKCPDNVLSEKMSSFKLALYS